MRTPALLNRESSLVLLIDFQTNLLRSIDRADSTVANGALMARVAGLLGVPVLATTQNADKLGALCDPIASVLPAGSQIPNKMVFSAARDSSIIDAIRGHARPSIVIAGVETHICVAQTAIDLQAAGFDVTVVVDACSSRTVERHKLGMERIRDFGVMPAATESVIYEWLERAGTDEFRVVLPWVK
jgi:hypothetical protein